MYDEFLLRVDASDATIVPSSKPFDLSLKERQHLQEWILKHPQLLGDGVAIVTSEYDKWQTAKGELIRDRLDVLGIDVDGRLVVAELKGDIAPHTIHMQAINYAAMVSRLTPSDVAELWAHTHAPAGTSLDTDSVLAELQTKWLLTADSIKAPRIVLLATSFPATVTAAVVWLNEQGVDITLIRFRPYQLEDGQVLVTFSRLYPVPSVEEFTIGRRVTPGSEGVALKDDVPWDLSSLLALAAQANEATIEMMDLCAAEEADGVSVADIASHAEISAAQVKGQLAGLTMRLKNPRYGFRQTRWPVDITWQSGIVSYSLTTDLAALWRQARSSGTASLLPEPAAPDV